MIKQTLNISDLRRIANIAMNHLDFIKKQEGKEFPASDKRIRGIALQIAASHNSEWIIDYEN